MKETFRKYICHWLFVASAIAYFANRTHLAFADSAPTFMSSHFNDMFTMPFMLPIFAATMAWCTKKPYVISLGDIIGLFILWSIIFEVASPMVVKSVGDPLDVVAYAVGGLVFAVVFIPKWSNKHLQKSNA